MDQYTWEQAAAWLHAADALLIAAGAGMGVDSGLPDFRGDEGFWKAYPPFAKARLRFVELANPQWFWRDPALAWGFYGHRLNLYRQTKPHVGFATLLKWGQSKPAGYFVFTSNVDGQFQRAGFAEERLCECHGSLHHLQRLDGREGVIWSAAQVRVEVDQTTFRAAEPWPCCPHDGSLARPNVLMFGDAYWVKERTEAQHQRLRAWLQTVCGQRLVIVECGAGTAVPTVRLFCEKVASAIHVKLIRLNVREPQVPPGHIGLAAGAQAALAKIEQFLPTS